MKNENKITWEVEGAGRIHEIPAEKPVVVRFEGENGWIEVKLDEEGCLHLLESIPLCCK